MQALIIHLSDIHFKENDELYEPLSDRIAKAVCSVHSACEHCLILVTGDIAYSGNPKEYVVAKAFLDRLSKGLENINSKVSIYFCPGNHDCNFEKESTVRDMLIEQLQDGLPKDLKADVIDAICVVQDDYFNFQNHYQKSENKLLSRYTVKIGEKILGIDCLNVAWMSSLRESQGKLLYPIDLITDQTPQTDLNIALYHHPINWLEANNARDLEEKLEERYHLIFTGHEHRDRYVSVVNLTSSDTSIYVHGGVLCESGSNNSSFTTIEIDMEDGAIFSRTWKYHNEQLLYLTEDEDCRSIDICEKSSASANKIILQGDFSSFLNSVDLPFEHPRVNTVTLDKLYISVQLSASGDINEEQGPSARIFTSSLHKKVVSENYLSVLGEPQSGKTATLKILFKNLLKAKLIPVYIQGESLKKNHRQEVDKAVRKAVKAQYRSPSYEYIQQNHRKHIVILIDNFDLSPLNASAKDDLINYLSQRYEHIVLTMGVSSFAASIARKSETSLLSVFTTYELDEFSYSARGELIEAWVRLGQEDSLGQEELNKIASKKEQLMNSLVKNNLLPILPGHVLLVLQYMETGSVNPDMNGAYGHIYQALVTSMLGRVKRIPVDVLIAYLANMAFDMYSKKTTSLDEIEVEQSHISYVTFSDIVIDIESTLEALKEIHIIKEISGHISFRHPYLLYYFVAMHINKRLSYTETEVVVDNMIKAINRDDSCNILIFYSHFANHVAIVDKIINKISGQFDEFAACEFKEDIREISKFYCEVAAMVVNEENHLHWRKERNKQLDKNRSTRKNRINNSSNSEFGLEYRLNSAYRSIDVLGQILQGNISILSGDKKVESVTEGAKLCLRIISSFNEFIKDNAGQLTEEIKNKCLAPNLLEAEKARLATKLVSAITEMVVFSILKKLSSSFNSKALYIAFNKLAKENSDIPAYKLINAMIGLDNSSSFPKNAIEEAYHDIKEYHLGKRMLQRLVWSHFMKYRVEYSTKQWASNLLNIQYVPSKKSQEPPKLIR